MYDNICYSLFTDHYIIKTQSWMQMTLMEERL